MKRTNGSYGGLGEEVGLDVASEFYGERVIVGICLQTGIAYDGTEHITPVIKIFKISWMVVGKLGNTGSDHFDVVLLTNHHATIIRTWAMTFDVGRSALVVQGGDVNDVKIGE